MTEKLEEMLKKTNADFADEIDDLDPEEFEEDQEEKVEDDSEEEPAQDEPVQEEPEEQKQEPKSEEPVKDKDYYAQQRIARREAARQAQMATQQPEKPKPVEQPKPAQDDPEPAYDGTEASRIARLEWESRQYGQKLNQILEERTQTQQAREAEQTWNGAIQEYQNIETSYRRANPDYDAAFDHMQAQITNGIRALNPTASPQQVAQAALQHILVKAGQYSKQGLNPAEEFVSDAYELYGYEKQQAAPELPAKSNRLENIERNKRRSASPTAGGGRASNVQPTLSEAKKMTNADFLNLDPQLFKSI